MSELLKKSLQKYIDTGKASKLEIFATSCNPDVKLTPKKLSLLKELVEEYIQDPVVFDDILAFCGYSKPSPNQATTLAEIAARVDADNLEKYRNTQRYDILDEVVKSNLGDVKDPTSIAYKVCNNQIHEFKFPSTAYRPDVVIKRLLRRNFVEANWEWRSFWNDQDQCWICTTNPSYELKTRKHIDEKS